MKVFTNYSQNIFHFFFVNEFERKGNKEVGNVSLKYSNLNADDKTSAAPTITAPFNIHVQNIITLLKFKHLIKSYTIVCLDN